LSSRRQLGLGSAAAVVVASMVGAGVFTTSGFALADLGTPGRVLAAWLVGGVVALCGALCYGALGRRFPESGGEYHLLRETVHPLAGFLAGWVSLLAGFTAPTAAAALGLQAYLAPFLGGAVDPRWIGTGAVALACLLHGSRVATGVVAQNLAVGLKLVLLAGFVLFGGWTLLAAPAAAPAPPVAPPPFEWGAFAVSLVWIGFAYSGWNAAVYVAGELRDPSRDLHRSLLLGAGAVTLLYLGLNAVFLHAAPVEQLAGRAEVGAVAADALGGAGLNRAVSALVALALFTSVSSLVMLGPRVYARMAEDGLFPRVFRAGSGAPAAAVALQGGLAVVVIWLSELAELLGYLGFTLGLSAAATVVGLVRHRRREGAAALAVPLWPLPPLIFLLATLGSAVFLLQRRPAESLGGLLTVVAGVPVWWALRRSGRRAGDAAAPKA
jgi:amino acid transporter